ncbi:hypothetical protein K474DRAFT_1630029 [Panus rudis PR-1116 ss-1]|nr:hypothetical protein K474DRAFT_1630029 [Panus rudis PR-1116 ss-1]
MILNDTMGDTNNNTIHDSQHNDGLPSYDMAIAGQVPANPSVPYVYGGASTTQSQDMKKDVPPPPQHSFAGPSGSAPQRPFVPPRMPTTTVYNYMNPHTGEQVASLLPPDHPQMVCLQEGRHVRTVNFGPLGIIAAIIWFPLGIGLCLLDRRVKCKRCGIVLDEGLCH